MVDKTEQLVNEKLELLKKLKQMEDEEAKGKDDTVTKEIIGPGGLGAWR